jgi:hypothetical protein
VILPAHLALPSLPTPGCGAGLLPVCAANGAGSSLAGGLLNGLFGGLVDWVVNGASWLLDQIGAVITATTPIDLSSGWFGSHFAVMASLAAVVLVPLLLAGIMQAVYHQDAGQLLRTVLVRLPLAVLFTAVVLQLVRLALSATDGLSSAVGSGADVSTALSTLATGLSGLAGTGVPAFAVLLGAVLVALGALTLWLELVVRAAAVYVAVLFLPLALASLVWPAVGHWCRRLVDTLVALILSKFVIVAVLSLASAELASGTGFASVLGGAALLLLAAFTPFTLLRLVPAVEAGAVHHLEGARQRAVHAATGPPRAALSAASFALARAGGTELGDVTPGTGLGQAAGLPGEGDGSGAASGNAEGAPTAIPSWPATPAPDLGGGAARPTPPPGRPEPGPSPLWGSPGEPEDPEGAEPASGRGHHELGRDRLGPVIRWIPPAGEGAPADHSAGTDSDPGAGAERGA